MDFADVIMFIYISNILATTNISKAIDENGVPIIPTMKSALKERVYVFSLSLLLEPDLTCIAQPHHAFQKLDHTPGYTLHEETARSECAGCIEFRLSLHFSLVYILVDPLYHNLICIQQIHPT